MLPASPTKVLVRQPSATALRPPQVPGYAVRRNAAFELLEWVAKRASEMASVTDCAVGIDLSVALAKAVPEIFPRWRRYGRVAEARMALRIWR